jgi:predicted amidohydrolase YtcJ
MSRTPILIRDVEVAGVPGVDVRLEDGRIFEIGPRLARTGAEIAGNGGALIPGLADHHIHLFALAAQAESVSLDGVTNTDAFRTRIAAAAAMRPPGAWLRVTGYHEAMAGELSRLELDACAPAHPLRVQHQTGSLWILNSRGLDAVGDLGSPVVERDAGGKPTGRIWRGDAWLRQQIGEHAPPLASVGRRLAAFGITALTDASVTTDAQAAERLAAAHRAGELPQRLTLMSGGPLGAPADGAFAVGPVKVLLDDHDLPDIDAFARLIAEARRWRRTVGVHCVTAAELAVALAAFEAAGARVGDRIEHGGLIPEDAIAQLKALELTVVTQPGFIRERGDRYAAMVEPREHADLYRCASLLAAGVPVAASSDAPYASPDPWVAMKSAVDRRSRGGLCIGAAERVTPAQALTLYLGSADAPGGPPRRVEVGAPADLCLLATPLQEALQALSAQLVRATFVGGRMIHQADEMTDVAAP